MSGIEQPKLDRRQKRWVGRRQKKMFGKAMGAARERTSKQIEAMRPEKGDNWFCPKHGRVPTVHQHYRGNLLVCGLCQKKARTLDDVEMLTDKPISTNKDIVIPGAEPKKKAKCQRCNGTGFVGQGIYCPECGGTING